MRHFTLTLLALITFCFASFAATELPEPAEPECTEAVAEDFACDITNISVISLSACIWDNFTAKYNVTLRIDYQDAPSSGVMNIDLNGTVIQVGYDDNASFKEVIIPNLTADGQFVDVTASFSANSGCSMTVPNLYQAPADCNPNPECSISFEVENMTACYVNAFGQSVYDVDIRINYVSPPNDGGSPPAAVGDIYFTHGASSGNVSYSVLSDSKVVSLTGTPATGGPIDVSATFTAEPECTNTAVGLYTAPAPCGPPVCAVTNLAVDYMSACQWDGSNSTFDVTIAIDYVDGPGGNMNVYLGSNFQSVPTTPGAGTLLVDFFGIPANGASLYLITQFAADTGCGLSDFAFLTAPSPCPGASCSIDNITIASQSACMWDGSNSTYDIDLEVAYSNSGGGTLQASIGPNIQQVNTSAGSGIATVSFTGLTANGLTYDANAYFTAESSCTLTETNLVTAPIACPPAACIINSITVSDLGECTWNGVASLYDVDISVSYSGAQAGDNLAVNVGGVVENVSLLGANGTALVTVSGNAADGLMKDITATISGSVDCTDTSTDAFLAPSPCEPAGSCITGFTVGSPLTCEWDGSQSVYDLELTILMDNPPAGSTLDITVGSFNMTQFLPTSVSSFTVNIDNTLIADGMPVDVSVFIQEAPTTCTLTEESLYTAPAGCFPTCDYASSVIPPTDGVLRFAISSCTDGFGWTHYYDFADYLLLSIYTGGQDIGTPGDGTFMLSVGGNAGAVDLSSAPYVSNPDGWGVMGRYWDVTPTNQPTAPVLVRFYYMTADFTSVQSLVTSFTNGSLPSHQDMYFFKIATNEDPNPSTGHSNVDITEFTQLANGGSPSTSSWVYSPFLSYHCSEFAVNSFSGGGGGGGGGTNSGVLPVELTSFYGVPQQSNNLLKWTTATEENTRVFEIQRSTSPDRDFESIGAVEAVGNSVEEQTYIYTDETPLDAGYYRLRIIDFDGTYEFSPVILVLRNDEVFHNVLIFPQPTRDILNVQLVVEEGKEDQKLELLISDAVGKVLRNQTMNLVEGINTFQMDIDDLAEGTYFIYMKTEGRRSLVRKFIKIRE